MPVTLVDGAGFQALHPALDARSRLSGYRVLASLDRLHVHSQFTPQSDAEISGAACDLRRIGACDQGFRRDAASVDAGAAEDRKSTRLNSSHSQISYAVFCLKKKKKN